MKGSSGLTAGFTLVELVVTIAVAAILLTIAIPSFTRTVVSARLSSAANEFVAALSQARLEAVRRNTTTQFCSNIATNNGTSTLGSSCGTSTAAVMVLEPSGATTLVRDSPLLTQGLLVGDGTNGTSAVVALQYDGTGQATAVGGTAPYTGLVADIYSLRINTNNHACVYLTTGSIVSTHTCSSACPTNEPTSSC